MEPTSHILTVKKKDSLFGLFLIVRRLFIDPQVISFKRPVLSNYSTREFHSSKRK